MVSDFFCHRPIILLILIICSYVPVSGQDILNARVSVSKESVRLKNLLKTLEKQVPIKFGYSNESISGNTDVFLKAGNTTLRKVINDICDQLNLSYDLVGDFVVLNSKGFVEGKITGIVTDENKKPVARATISTAKGDPITATDEDGIFKLALKNPVDELLISSIGFHPQAVPLKGRKQLKISLVLNQTKMDEVIVVGYGTQAKSELTGAVSVIRSADIVNQQVTTVESALQGRSSGVLSVAVSGAPGAGSNLRIRGNTSFNTAASNPLYVIDGIVVGSNNVDMIDPNEIESIEVLRDAASAAIYGARSSAGVILITTKKGKPGDLLIKYNTSLGVQKPSKKLELLNAAEYAMLRNEQSVNGGGEIVFENPQAFGEGTDWQEQVFNNRAFIQNHDLNVSGGKDGSFYFGSISLLDQEGVVATEISGLKRYNIRINSRLKIRDWISFGENIGYAHIKALTGVPHNTEFLNPLTSAVNLDPITTVMETNPAALLAPPYSNRPVIKDNNNRFYAVSENVAQQIVNPLAYIKTRLGNYEWADNIMGNVFFDIDAKNGLKARSVVGANLRYWGNEMFLPVFYLNGTQTNTQTSFQRVRNKRFNWNIENTVSYEKGFGSHRITALLGQGAYMDNNSSGLSVTYFNIPATTFEEASMNYSLAPSSKIASGFEGIQHTVSSLFGRLNYNYDQKYLFSGILRRDGSSRFGANNKFGYFPSVSAGWVISRERFFKSEKVDFFKVRVSYGKNGNDVLGDFRWVSTIDDGKNYTFGSNEFYLIGQADNAPANPDLRWEETQQVNVGLDARFRSGFFATVDWFNKATSGILMPVVFPRYAGISGIAYGNIGNMKNTGVEFELGHEKNYGLINIKTKANAAYVRNRVTYLGRGLDFTEDGALTLQSSAYALTRTAVGQPLNSFYGFKTNGIFQSLSEIENYAGVNGMIQPKAVPGDFRWVDLNGDGRIDANDRTFLGSPVPSWTFGLSINLSYKEIDFLLFGQGVYGNKVFQGLRRLDIATANWPEAALSRWHGEGTSNNYPRLTTNDINMNFSSPSGFYLQDAGYFRIKTLQLGYNIPEKIVSRIGIKKARIYISSNNFATFTKYTGFDPEIGGTSNGVDRGVYPQPKSLVCGINLSI